MPRSVQAALSGVALIVTGATLAAGIIGLGLALIAAGCFAMYGATIEHEKEREREFPK